MSTFLALCEDLARESGGTARAPTSVTGQTGRSAKIVGWVASAWKLIQNAQANWTFLRGEWIGTMTIGQSTYTGAQIAFTAANNITAVARFGEFIGDYGRYQPLTIYDASIGKADENALRQITWEQWRTSYGRGVVAANRPSYYCIDPAGSLRFDAAPDKAYVLGGEYTKVPQVLAADGDVPDMPTRFHDIIVWRAIKLMADSDEAVVALQLADQKYREMLVEMERDLLPKFNVRAGRPLA